MDIEGLIITCVIIVLLGVASSGMDGPDAPA